MLTPQPSEVNPRNLGPATVRRAQEALGEDQEPQAPGDEPSDGDVWVKQKDRRAETDGLFVGLMRSTLP